MIESRAGCDARPGTPAWRAIHEAEVAALLVRHGTLRQLCCDLEQCANHLPERLAIVEAAAISDALADALAGHDLAGDVRLATADSAEAGERCALSDRIRYRYTIDRLHAEDLRDALALAAASGRRGTDTLGYMMRCLFDGCRRNIDLEATVLLLARERMTVPARAALTKSLSAG